MSWKGTFFFKFVFAMDLWFAAIFFGQFGFSISSMAGMVRAGQDTPLELRPWQRAFLNWLEPRLSREHCKGAIRFDRWRAQFVLDHTSAE